MAVSQTNSFRFQISEYREKKEALELMLNSAITTRGDLVVPPETILCLGSAKQEMRYL